MTTDTTSPAAEAETALFLGEDWFDPLEAGGRTRIRSFIEELLEAELDAALSRKRYERGRTPDNGPSSGDDRLSVTLVMAAGKGRRQLLREPVPFFSLRPSI